MVFGVLGVKRARLGWILVQCCLFENDVPNVCVILLGTRHVGYQACEGADGVRTKVYSEANPFDDNLWICD